MNDSQEPSRQRGAKPRRAWQTDAQWKQLRARIDASGSSSHPPALAIDPGVRSPWRVYAGVALAASAALAAVLLSRRDTNTSVLHWTTAASAAGQRDTVQLPDSTIIILGPATTVRYALSATQRDVQLDGLADFSVIHDPQRVFRVYAGNAVITDIGTEFVVRSYEGDAATRVAVSAGTVELGDTRTTRKVVLPAGTSGTLTQSGVPSVDTNPAVAASAAWLQGQLIFTNQPLAEVATELSRWFGVTVRVDDPALAARRVTAVYSNATLPGVLDALRASLGIVHARQDSIVTLTRARR